ncbi:ABC transporter permease [Litorilinea aerophila]|uniref:ABC transporter permease n=1 Tax=Litorilinea aerophila TaxID=1204385 RepID=A0A540VM57_9CHLR|nr:ABC transporter permease [Litorilinea aerophila]MCC9074543.1 ABC transporter permease [Litorilinea aerophila]
MGIKLAGATADQTKHRSQEDLLLRKPQTYWRMAVQSLARDRLTLAAMAFVTLLAVLAMLAEPITETLVGVGPNQTNPANAFQQPYLIPYIQWRLGLDPMTAPLMLGQSGGIPHWLGTDQLGRDQLARLLYGGRVSLTVAFSAAAIALVLGVFIGAVAGYFGGVVDDVVMWIINTLVSIPGIYLLIIVSAIFKPNPTTLTLFLGFLGWFGTARFVRGNVFKIKALDFVLAARALGARDSRILWQHLIPNSIPVIIVVTAIDIGTLILVESSLSFLGLGIQPPTATWGSMLTRANNFVFLRDPATGQFTALHLLVAPGLLITLTVLAFYLIGDGLRDALDPRLKR